MANGLMVRMVRSRGLDVETWKTSARRAQIEARASLALLLTLIFSALLQRHSTNSDCHLLVLRNLQLDLSNLSSVLEIPDETGVL